MKLYFWGCDIYTWWKERHFSHFWTKLHKIPYNLANEKAQCCQDTSSHHHNNWMLSEAAAPPPWALSHPTQDTMVPLRSPTLSSGRTQPRGRANRARSTEDGEIAPCIAQTMWTQTSLLDLSACLLSPLFFCLTAFTSKLRDISGNSYWEISSWFYLRLYSKIFNISTGHFLWCLWIWFSINS